MGWKPSPKSAFLLILKLASNEDHVSSSMSYSTLKTFFYKTLKKQYTFNFISRAKCAKKSPIFITCNLIYQRCTAHTIKIHFWNSLLRPKRNDSWTSDSLMLSSFQWTFTSHFNDFYFSIFHFFIFFLRTEFISLMKGGTFFLCMIFERGVH